MRARLPILLAAAALVAAATAVPARAEATAARAITVEHLTSCVQRSHALLVDIQMDRSRSLRGTDPDGQRVAGVAAALTGLARLDRRARDLGEPLRVEVRLSSFDGSVTTIADWQQLTDDTLNESVIAAKRYRALDHDRDTDYVAAMRASEGALLQKASRIRESGRPVPCKMILFVTDGRFEFGVRAPGEASTRAPYGHRISLTTPAGAEAAASAGRDVLCNRRGSALMDRVAGEDILLFTVALSRRMTRRARKQLESMTVGTAGHQSCGTKLSKRTGAFFLVNDASDLFLELSGLLGDAGGTRRVRPCPVARCPEGTRTFPVVAGMLGVSLDASAGSEGLAMALTDPQGLTRTVPPAPPAMPYVRYTLRFGAARVTVNWIAARSLSLDAHVPRTAGPWDGAWRFAFVDPSGTSLLPVQYRLRFTADEQPALSGTPDLVIGQDAAIAVRLVDHEGQPLPAGVLARATHVGAGVTDALNQVRPSHVTTHGDGTYVVHVHVPTGPPADGDWTLKLIPRARLGDGVVALEERAPRLGRPHLDSGPPVWLLALLVPLALGFAAFAGVTRRRARFVAPQRVLVFECAAKIVPRGEVVLTPDPDALGDRVFRRLLEGGRDASVATIDRGELHLRRAFGAFPYTNPYGEARDERCQLLGGRDDGRPLALSDRRHACRVPLTLAGTWLFAIDVLEAERVEGRLLAFTSSTLPVARRRRVIEAARTALRAQRWDGYEPRPRRRVGISAPRPPRRPGGPPRWEDH